jgi:hypothetical protein
LIACRTLSSRFSGASVSASRGFAIYNRLDVLRQNRAVADAEGTINAKTTMTNKI